jgi:isoleucyl-tRNA synthetase
MPGQRDDLGVFTAEWYDGLFDYSNTEIDGTVWDSLEQVRAEVTRTLEVLRQDGQIGSSLDAEVSIHANPELIERLQVISDELRFVMITSSAQLVPLDAAQADGAVKLRDGNRVLVQASPSGNAKCARCWHHRDDVGSHTQHPELCGRCIDNVDGSGEQRRYA